MSRNIIACGYSRSPEERVQEFVERQCLQSNLLLLLLNAEKILNTPQLYFCSPSCCWCSFSYVTADGPIPLYLGNLLEGYRNQIFIEDCPNCQTKTLMTICFEGSPLSRSNTFWGYCISCASQSKVPFKPSALIDRMKFVGKLRGAKPLYLSEWIVSGGYSSDWSNDWRKPAEKRELVTRKLYRPLGMRQVVASLVCQSEGLL